MKKFNIVKTIDGHHFGQVIDTYDSIEDARKCLAEVLAYAGGDDWHYFANAEDAEADIAFFKEATAEDIDWSDDRTCDYFEALREGIADGTPFIANSVDCACISLVGDRFRYDNYTVEIVEEE